jgi:hypothetical protein
MEHHEVTDRYAAVSDVPATQTPRAGWRATLGWVDS